MRRFRPHLIIIGGYLLMLLIVISLSPGAAGALLGATVGSITDPALFTAALLLGLICFHHTFLLTVALAASGIAFSVWISIINADLGAKLTPYIIFIKVLAFLLVGFLSNAITQLLIACDEQRLEEHSAKLIRR